jgi:DNA-binding NarL/FixJ family response regulator
MREILVIEDHGVVRAGISHILEREPGLEVAGTAGNGEQALNLVKNGLRPDVILCDLHLGDMSGIDLVRELQQLAPEAGVIMLTVEASECYVSEAFQAGAKGYLLKEADSDDLIYAIKKVLQGKNFICTGLARRYKEKLLHSQHVAAPEPEIELSERESEVLHLLADGFTNIEVADRLFTSKRTVEGHRLSLLHKTGARNGLELIKLAMLQGLLNIPERTLS